MGFIVSVAKIGIISESSKYFSQKVHTGSDPMCTSTFFIHIDRCTVGEGNAVGSIEGFQVNPAVTKSQPDFHKRLQQREDLLQNGDFDKIYPPHSAA